MDTKEQMKKIRATMATAYECLQEMSQQLNELEAALDPEAAAPAAAPEKPKRMTLAEAAAVIRDGGIDKIQIGDPLISWHDDYGTINWTVIGKNCEALTGSKTDRPHITVMADSVVKYGSFDHPDKRHPYGCNEWEISSMRADLTDFYGGLSAADANVVLPVLKKTYVPDDKKVKTTIDRFFLLSASEAGFKPDGKRVMDEGDCYEYFKPAIGDYDAEEPMRQLEDYEDDAAPWWLRSPTPGIASYVRCVSPDGSLNHIIANNGDGAAPACVIG